MGFHGANEDDGTGPNDDDHTGAAEDDRTGAEDEWTGPKENEDDGCGAVPVGPPLGGTAALELFWNGAEDDGGGMLALKLPVPKGAELLGGSDDEWL